MKEKILDIMDKHKLIFLGVIVTSLLLSFWLGLNVGYTNNRQVKSLAILSDKESLPPENVDFSPLWKAWNVLEDRFVPATTTLSKTSQDYLWGSIRGLAASYGDPYTVFFPPAESTVFEEDINGSFGGVGMEIGVRDGVLTVVSPLKSTPAEKAGVKSGDWIMEIDGKSTDKMSVDEAVQKIRGEVGKVVTLTISREGNSELKTIEITRAVINIPTIDTEMRKDGIFVISLYNFSALSPNLFRTALKEFVQSNSNKLVLDLRNNPGGFLAAAIDMASWFLPAGKVVVTEDFGKGVEPKIHRSKGYNIFTNQLKMVILVNGGSASASEILAGALQEQGVATLIGQSTFGKGSVQEVIKITPDTSLKVTIARWLTPNGISISDGGLTPEVKVEMTAKDVEAGKDPQLQKAVSILLKK